MNPLDSTSDSSNLPSVQQTVTGNDNQVIAHAINSTIIKELILQQPQSPESARYSLPIDAADFIGRDREIQQIEADLSAGRVVSIVGMAGVGKSALAVRVAHRIKAAFPGGQIYLNLRGTDTQPLSVEAALETLLRALGVDPAQIPTELAERSAMYRSRVALEPTLVLLDNAADARQVADLLPGAGACLITSRRQLDGLAGVKPIDLEALPEAEALELLQKVLPLERVQAELEAARQIVGDCGRLPLALRIAAATLGMRSWQRKRLAEYARQLGDQRQRLDRLRLDNLDVRASFELSYRELEGAAAGLLGWLGLLPGDFGTAILLPLTAEPTEVVQVTLAALVDGRLVDPAVDSEAERYVLHDLMRLFAQEKLAAQAEPAAVAAAKVRLVQWCGERANIWENALNPVRRRQWAEALAAERAMARSGSLQSAADLEPRLLQVALRWFEAERQTLVQAFGWAAETQEWQASVALAANLAHFFNLRSYWGDWVGTHQQALTAARQADDQRGEGQMLNNLGNVYCSQSKWNEAIDCYEQSLQIFRAIDDVHSEALPIMGLGNVYYSQGKWNEAIDCYEQSLQIKRAIGDAHGEALSINNLGNVYYSQGKWNEAIDCYEQSLQIFRAIGDAHGEALPIVGLGLVYQFQGKWNEAINCYEQSLQIKRAIGDAHGEGQTLNNLGNVYHSQGKWNEAIDCYEQSLQIFRAIGDAHGEGQTLNNLGNVYQFQGKWNEAIDCYEQSLQIKRAIGDVHGEALPIAGLGNVYHFQGKWNEAIDCYEQSLQIYRAIGDVHGEGQILNNLGLANKSQGKWNEAIDCYEQSLQIYRAIGDVHGEGQTLNNLGMVYQSQGKWNEAICCYEQSLQIKRAIGDVHGEGQTLMNLGLVYELQKHLDQVISLWREALTKIHPDSPAHATVTQWLQDVTQPEHPN